MASQILGTIARAFECATGSGVNEQTAYQETWPWSAAVRSFPLQGLLQVPSRLRVSVSSSVAERE